MSVDRTLSERMRLGREAAPWVIEEVEKLEDRIPRWIPVEEQRPEKHQVVMCKCLEDVDQPCYYVSEKDWGEEGMSYHFKSAVTNKYKSVLAWFPLPKYEYEDDI